MKQILEIDDYALITENGVKVQRFIFNDDKIIKVRHDDGIVLTKNAPDKYLEIISAFNVARRPSNGDIDDRIAMIKTGEGAGLFGFVGFLCSLTLIGSLIAYAASFRFLNDISDKDYLLNADAREINQRKGFYAWACYGNLFVGLFSMAQWKTDMISVLEDKPSSASQNKHIVFKIVWPFLFIITLFCLAF